MSGYVLLVEDSENDALLLHKLWQTMHIINHLVDASTGFKAMAFLKDGSNPVPMLMLLDLKLPDMDGIDVLKYIRANGRLRNIPVILFTSTPDQEHLITAMGAGANAYLRKGMGITAPRLLAALLDANVVLEME